MSKRRHKPGVSSQTFKRNPSFASQRAASNEFTTANHAATLLIHSVAPLVERIRTRDTQGWILKNMSNVLKTDVINPKGERQVQTGNLVMLQGLEFSKVTSLSTIFPVKTSANINRADGIIRFVIPSFNPKRSIRKIPGATHFKIVSAGVEADFSSETSIQHISDSDYLLLNDQPTGDLQLDSAVTPNSGLPLFHIVAIQFYNETNGTMCPLNDKKYHPVTIVKVDQVN
jgi:hypothetical protein